MTNVGDQFFLIRWDANWRLVITSHDTVEDAKESVNADVAPAMVVKFEWIGKDLNSYTVAFRNIQHDNHAPRETWTNIIHKGSSN